MAAQKALVAYFSGTGGTTRAAKAVAQAFELRGVSVDIQEIKTGKAFPNGSEDYLVLLFAVHAANAPEPVYRWLENLSPVSGTKAAVLAVSGGGEVFPNTACRLSSIKRLEKKGYEVVYEHMIVMPSNMSIATPDGLAARLLEVLPQKAASMADDILSGIRRRVKPSLLNRFMSVVCEMEKKGCHIFGKWLIADETCTGCGWCAKGCPGANIRMEGERPVFGNQCVMCFRCVYGCPSHSLRPKRFKFALNKRGFDIRRYENSGIQPEKKTGVVWKGVNRYLEQ